MNNSLSIETSNQSTISGTLDLKLIEDAFDRGILYLVYIEQSNQQFNSISLVVLNKWRTNLVKNQDEHFTHTIKGF